MSWYYWMLGLGSKIRVPGRYGCSQETIHPSVRVLSGTRNKNMQQCRALKGYTTDGKRWTCDDHYIKEDMPSVAEREIFEEWWIMNMERDTAEAESFLEVVRDLQGI